MKKTLYIVVPCYNEEECLNETTKRLSKKLDNLVEANVIDKKSRIVYVDDGSKDKTWEKIESFGGPVIGVKLSRNRGHQNALLAGLMYAKEHADVVISMDADLQDDIDAIDKMLDKFADGYEIVYGVRSERKNDTTFKRNTALAFYKLMNKLGAEVVYNSADYRLMSKRALEELAEYKEVNLFLRGLVPLIGLKSTKVEYPRAERFAGESKYPLKKMVKFAWDGITSFSIKPIRMILWLGVIIFFISLVITLYALIMKLLGNVVSGWTFIICSIWILGGLQMISLGLVGEYIGKIYAESKHRPRYTIEKIIGE
ncbi:glycosyltransferase family 2 protein [Candidatus Saccharibacteria bacterium]|nr:glycosyltransferase family 2 protein [Candidatus Saccharibacteria bacterium]